MSEIGSLEVSLSLNAANFNGTISQVNQNMKAMGSELTALKAKGSDYEKSVEGLTQKQDILQRSFDASAIKLQEQRKRYDELVESGKATETQLTRAANEVNKAQAEYNKFETQLKKVSSELDDATNKWKQAGQSMQDFGTKTSDIGGKLTSVGTTLTTSLTTPIVALGTAALATAAQFDTAQAKMQGQLGLTATEAEKLTTVAQDVWAKGFGESLEQVTTDLATLKQQFSDLNDAELSKLLESSYTLNELFGFEINETTRTASVLMKNFGVDGQTAMDLITVGAQRGGDFSGELLDTLREYAPQFKALGYDAEEFTAILVAGAESGAFNLDKVGDAAKESFLRIGDGSKSSRDALGALGLDFQKIEGDINAGGESANSAFAAVVSAISTVEDPAKKAQLAIALMGTPLEDLGPEFQNFFATANTDLGNFEGSTQKASETLQQSFGERLQSTMRTAQEALLPLGETLLDLAEEWLPKISSTAESVAKWFNDLSPTAQNVTLAIGGIVAAAGPLLAIGGTVISGIGSISTALGTLSTAIGAAGGASALFGTALGVLSGPVGWTVLGVAAIGTAAVVTANELSESSIQVEGFADKVSESTVEAVGSFLEMSDQATVSLNQMAWSGATVTQEMADNLVSIYNEMGNQIITEMQSDHAEQLATMQTFFDSSAALSEQEESEIITNMQTKQSEKEQVIADGQARIAEILNTAKTEKRSITEAEQQEINAIQQTMTENAVEYLTENEREQKVILENLKNEASKITAEQAAEVVQNSLKQKEEVVKEAEEQYNKTIAEITKQRDEMGTISDEQAQKLIAAAQKQRDETVKNAEDMHQKVVSEAKTQADEHVSKVDWETGEVKSKWESMKTDVSQKMKETGAAIKKDWTNAWNDTKSAVGNIYQSATTKFTEIKEGIEKKMKEVRTSIETKWEEAEKYLSKVDLLQVGKDIINGLVKGMKAKFETVIETLSELTELIPNWVKEALDIRSPSRVMMEIGKWTGIGLAVGIESTKKRNEEAVKKLTEGIEFWTKERHKAINELNEKQAKEEAQNTEHYLSAIAQIKERAVNQNRELKENEIKEIERLEFNLAERLQQIQKNYERDWTTYFNPQFAESIKQQVYVIKDYIEEKRELQEMSLIQEAAIWEKTLTYVEEGTKEYEIIVDAHQKAIAEINAQIQAVNQSHLDRVNEINTELANSEKRLNDEYTNQLNSRANTLKNFAGLFDSFTSSFVGSGADLINNLDSQVVALEEYNATFNALAAKIGDQELVDELKAMGPKAIGELKALNSLSQAELDNFVMLYQKKSELAVEQATLELTGLKETTEQQIIDMRNAANAELDKVAIDWQTKMAELVSETEKELVTLEQVGINAGQGLLSGLASMQSSIQAKALEIANGIRETIKYALDINSPSRVMRGFGVNIGEGLVLGMNAMTSKVANASAKLAESVTSGYVSTSTSTSTVDNSKTFAPVINNYSNGDTNDTERMLRRMLFDF